jgi:hypothetical protein
MSSSPLAPSVATDVPALPRVRVTCRCGHVVEVQVPRRYQRASAEDTFLWAQARWLGRLCLQCRYEPLTGADVNP